ncbi:uncharacterized protein LOC100876279 [Megachile rotundata]|uniref:uncharacterized protein LOC100876279 n=1 Tax=Megachile rotundata TaxID=143995 RepID=UPI003FCF4F20
MKMTDSNEQNDCYVEAVTPIKRKKLKQAQLPFQIRSPTQSPNVIQTKKRKLSSPTVGCKSAKAVKVSKTVSKKDVNSKSSDSEDDTPKKDNNIKETTENIEIENVKENTTSNKVLNKSITPKHSSIGKKKIEKQDKSQSISLTKFLKKTDSKENSSLTEEKDTFIDESFDAEMDANVSISMHNDEKELSGTVNNSLSCDVDSDGINLSSNSDGNGDDLLKSYENTEQSVTSDNPKTPKIRKKKLTPTQQEKKLLSTKKKEEMQKRRKEKEMKLEEERNNRRKEKEMKRKEREEKVKAEKEQKLLEKKMKEQKKQQELEQKQKEKQAKEEERKRKEEAKEEERRKKEEEKLEAERKKEKAAANFTSFFVTKKQEKSIQEESTTEIKNFMPFEVKADMKIAPHIRRILKEDEKLLLDEKCKKGNTQILNLYLSEIKNKKIIPRKSTKTWPLEAKDDIVILDDENEGNSNIVNQNIVIEKHRPKLLQFSENQRPPYWGTWRKRSGNIKPRKPFSKDTQWFNYDVDSDEEWEEEEPGESLHGSDEEKDEENPDDNEYDVDNEFMVPHGYLSDEEIRADEEDKEDTNPETQKFKLKVLGQQFETERNTKTSKLKPKIIGCIWRGSNNEFAPNVPQKSMEFLTGHEAWVRQIPVILPTTSEGEIMNVTECGTPTQPQASLSSKKTRVPEEFLPNLIRLVHGNVHGRRFLVKEFLAFLNKENGECQVSKASLMKKICEIGKWMSCPEEGPMHLKSCWYVSEEVRKEYFKENLPLPNQWSYVTTPKRRSIFNEVTEKVEKEDKEKEKKNVSLITQFTKKISQEEMKKQLIVSPTQSIAKNRTSSPSLPAKPVGGKAPKRATLISVSRGEQFSKASKENLLKTLSVKLEKMDAVKDDIQIIDLCEDNNADNQNKKKTDFDEKKGEDNKLGDISMECESKMKSEEKSPKNTDKNKDIVLKSNALSETISDNCETETVNTLMDIDKSSG